MNTIKKRKEFIMRIVNAGEPNNCYEEVIKKADCDNANAIIKTLLESTDKKIISSQAYALASRLNLYGQHWSRLINMMGEKRRESVSDNGGLKIGNDEISIIIPNGYGKGITRYAVLDEDDITMDISEAMDYFTSINGKFNIYDYDCGDGISEVIEGNFAIYKYGGIVIFEKINDKDVDSEESSARRKFVTYKEAAVLYSIGLTKMQEYAKNAGAVYKIGNKALVNTDVFETYLETFRIPGNYEELARKVTSGKFSQ